MGGSYRGDAGRAKRDRAVGVELGDPSRVKAYHGGAVAEHHGVSQRDAPAVPLVHGKSSSAGRNVSGKKQRGGRTKSGDFFQMHWECQFLSFAARRQEPPVRWLTETPILISGASS